MTFLDFDFPILIFKNSIRLIIEWGKFFAPLIFVWIALSYSTDFGPVNFDIGVPIT